MVYVFSEADVCCQNLRLCCKEITDHHIRYLIQLEVMVNRPEPYLFVNEALIVRCLTCFDLGSLSHDPSHNRHVPMSQGWLPKHGCLYCSSVGGCDQW